MQAGLRGRMLDVSGFFLMEAIVLVVVFISFSTVVVGWYSNFSSMKVAIMKRGQAIFIASNALERIRMHGEIPSQIDVGADFTATVSVNRNILGGDLGLGSFAEVTVCVKYNDRLDPVCLTTGILLHGFNAIHSLNDESVKQDSEKMVSSFVVSNE